MNCGQRSGSPPQGQLLERTLGTGDTFSEQGTFQKKATRVVCFSCSLPECPRVSLAMGTNRVMLIARPGIGATKGFLECPAELMKGLLQLGPLHLPRSPTSPPGIMVSAHMTTAQAPDWALHWGPHSPSLWPLSWCHCE